MLNPIASVQSGNLVKRKGCFFNMFIYLKEVWIFCWMCAWTECETDFMWWCLAWRSALTRRLHVANPAHVKHAGGRKTRLQHRSFHNSSMWVEGETWFSDGQPLRAHFNFCNALHDAALVHGVQKKKRCFCRLESFNNTFKRPVKPKGILVGASQTV